jgi:hypothetical protein
VSFARAGRIEVKVAAGEQAAAGCDVGVAIGGGVVRVAVDELGDGAIGALFPDRERGGGLGLSVVEICAERWGFSHAGDACVLADSRSHRQT